MNSKEYILPNGKKAVFEYDVCGIGKIALECMDELMGMITDRPQGEWVTVWDECGENENGYECSECGAEVDEKFPNCPYCGVRMKGVDDE